jgi:hypothetical protein
MTDPITPPPELIEQWMQAHSTKYDLARHAAQWGADQELEACCEWLVRNYNYPEAGNPLRAARRPKAPSLKEQALALIDDCTDPEGDYLDDNALSIIRRALEALPND